jgi:hypothetical protein
LSSSTSISDGTAIQRSGRFLLWLVVGLGLGLAAYGAMAVLLVTPESRLLVFSKVMMEAKLARLSQPQRPPHLIVIAGSNALYSINSAALAETVGRPVTNAAMQWNYAFMMMEEAAERIVPGDWVLLPLEWAFYENLTRRSPLEACYLIAQRRERLVTARDWAEALYDCNPRTLLLGARQRLTRMAGFDFSIPEASAMIGPEGDLLENTPQTATFAARHKASPAGVPAAPSGSADTAAHFNGDLPRLGAAIRRLQARGAEVYVSYPVAVDGAQAWPHYATSHWQMQLRDWVAKHGGRLISSPDAHAFPPGCFYDSNLHLHQGCTADNARLYGRELLAARAAR